MHVVAGGYGARWLPSHTMVLLVHGGLWPGCVGWWAVVVVGVVLVVVVVGHWWWWRWLWCGW